MTSIAALEKHENPTTLNTAEPRFGFISEKMPETLIQISKNLSKGLHLAQSEEHLAKIKAFKQDYYQADHPGVSEFHDDGLDEHAYVIYGLDKHNSISSTARLLPDGKKGFPEDDIFPKSVQKMRDEGKKLAELGRLVIVDNKVCLLRQYYKAIFDVASIVDIDIVLIVMKQRNLPSHKKIMAVEVLSVDMGNSWDDEQAPLCLVAWDMKALQPKFQKWVGRETSSFSKNSWNEYSPYHLGVLTSVQREVYQHISSKMLGNTLDLGCGSGRIMAYLQDNPRVKSYTGVDSSQDMLLQASWLKEKLAYEEAELVRSDIEDFEGTYDSILTIHSFYSWPDPEQILSHIYYLLLPGGVFSLVTPNDKFDVGRLSHCVKQELLGHPYYDDFIRINEEIAHKAKEDKLYLSIDKLIGLVRRAGFTVNAAHQQFFLGGATYLELGK